jgi:hypothetical protein
MASLIDVSALTINAEEAKDVASLIIEKLFVNSPMSEIHSIETGIHYKQQIPFIGSLSDSLVKNAGCVPETGTGISLSEKFWEPEIYSTRWEHCAADISGLFKLFNEKTRVNPDVYDKIGSKELGLIVSLIDRMLMEKIPTKVWFSDKAAALISGGGKFKAGTNLALYNVINGLWKQIFADVATGDSNYVVITENAAATYALQTLPVDAGLNYLTSVVNAADSRLLEDPSAYIQVTRSIADNYRNTLRTKTIGAGFLEVTEGGKPQLYFDGYKVIIRHDWSREIKALFDTGAKLDKPHRILFTTPSNIPIATPSVDDFTTLTSFYDQYRKSNIVDVAFGLDAKLLEDYMTVAAY